MITGWHSRDTLGLAISDALATIRTPIAELEMRLLAIGIDPMMIIQRGPTVVALGLVLSILTSLFRRMPPMQ